MGGDYPSRIGGKAPLWPSHGVTTNTQSKTANDPECARPRGQHRTKVRWLAANGMRLAVRELLRPRTGALRGCRKNLAACEHVEALPVLKLCLESPGKTFSGTNSNSAFPAAYVIT